LEVRRPPKKPIWVLKTGPEKATPAKIQTVKEFEELIAEYPIIGAANMISLPTKTVQKMRAQLLRLLEQTQILLIKITITENS